MCERQLPRAGVLCIGMQGADCDRLRLPLMVSTSENEEAMYTAFTVTVDLRHGITTGISAADRAKTLAALANPATTPEDLRKPGHIFPLRSRDGGVLVRPGHTEAAVDLSYYAGAPPGDDEQLPAAHRSSAVHGARTACIPLHGASKQIAPPSSACLVHALRHARCRHSRALANSSRIATAGVDAASRCPAAQFSCRTGL